ncbi:MAG: Crp/Fnr family transcriptional regulator [Chloroflexi bacterium]|nr:Crp/Fnr family transcriptional regulator [Chloroflexota bacterium]
MAESGAISQNLFLLQKGVAKEVISGQKGTEVTVALMRPGDVSGIPSALEDGPRSVRLIAVTECEFLLISQGHFVKELEDHPEVQREALRYVSRQVRDAHQWISNLV